MVKIIDCGLSAHTIPDFVLCRFLLANCIGENVKLSYCSDGKLQIGPIMAITTEIKARIECGYSKLHRYKLGSPHFLIRGFNSHSDSSLWKREN